MTKPYMGFVTRESVISGVMREARMHRLDVIRIQALPLCILFAFKSSIH